MTFTEFSELRLNLTAVWLPDTPYLTIDVFLDIIVKQKFPLLYLGWYLFCVVSGNICLPGCSYGNVLCITTSGNECVGRWVMPPAD